MAKSFRFQVSAGWRMFAIVVSIFVVYTVAFTVFQHNREKQYKISLLDERLQDCNQRLHRSIALDGAAAYESFVRESDPRLRVTVVDTTGRVLFDNIYKDYASLPDHRGRAEVAGAMRSGRAYVIDRLSESTNQEYFYSATFFSDSGLVIRTAIPYDATLVRSLEFDRRFFWVALVALLMLVLVLRVYASRLDSSINREKEESNSLTRKQLTQNISHELKTPVASIQGYLETITEHPDMDRETEREFLDRSLSQARRLSALIGDLSVLNKMWDAPQSWTFARVDVSKVISDISEHLELQMEKKGIHFEDKVGADVVLNGNQSLIYSIFRNLVDNAIAYSGGDCVSVSASDAGEFWKFTFRDNGTGVGEEHLARLFDRFYRVDEGRSRRTGGTGLGLAIVKNAVQLHGGTISVHNDNGLVFDFTLRK